MWISFATGTFYHRGLDYCLRLARDAGFDGVEYDIGPDYFLFGPDALARTVREVGLSVLSVHPPFSKFARLPFVPWPRRVRQALPRVTALASALGARLAVTHPMFFLTPSSGRADRYREALRLGRQAGRGIELAIENNQYNKRHRHYLLDDFELLVRFAEQQGCGITFDTCHTGANGEDLLAAYELARPLIRNIHLSDVRWDAQGKPRTHLPPGEGALPLATLLGKLAADRYDGLVTLELHPLYVNQFNTRLAARQLAQSAAYVREAISRGAPRPTDSGRLSEPRGDLLEASD
jgi:sugar phosphate isomerase/epimerase